MQELNDNFQHLLGEIVDPEVYLSVVNHDLRKDILHSLFILSMTGPITKIQIAESLDIGYHKMLYQLARHLNSFWKVDHDRKVRGAREEFISPHNYNTVYCLMGSDATIHILDPLANVFGKISEVGVRCDDCPKKKVDVCREKILNEPCFKQTPEIFKKKTIILETNNRNKPYTPIDHFLVCTIIKSLENEPCQLNIDCKAFVKKMMDTGLSCDRTLES